MESNHIVIEVVCSVPCPALCQGQWQQRRQGSPQPASVRLSVGYLISTALTKLMALLILQKCSSRSVL